MILNISRNQSGVVTVSREGINKKVTARKVEEEQTPETAIKAKIEKYAKMKKEMEELEKQMKEEKKEIISYMEENDISKMEGLRGTVVDMRSSERVKTTGKYTKYDYKDVQTIIPSGKLKKATEIRVNAEKVDAMVKAKEIESSIVAELEKVKNTYQTAPAIYIKK